MTIVCKICNKIYKKDDVFEWKGREIFENLHRGCRTQETLALLRECSRRILMKNENIYFLTWL